MRWDILTLPLGALFGLILSRAGATTFDFYAGLFLFQDLQLLWVIGTAAAFGAIGVAALKRFGPADGVISKEPLKYEGKPWRKGLVVGALLFGGGWGLSGACPGTALAMLGEGKLAALFPILGVLIGTWLFGVVQDRTPAAQ